MGGGQLAGHLTMPQDRLAWPTFGRRRGLLSFDHLAVTVDLETHVDRAGVPELCAPTERAVPIVKSRSRAAAMDAVIRNVKDGGGTTSTDGVSTRALTRWCRAGWVESR